MSYRPFVPGGECRSGVLIQPLQEDLQTPAELLDRRDGAAAPVGVGEHMSDEVRGWDHPRGHRACRAGLPGHRVPRAHRRRHAGGPRRLGAAEVPAALRGRVASTGIGSADVPSFPALTTATHPGVSIATAAATAVLAGAPVPPETWYRCELMTRESA
jgi:hypothetical protein